MAFGIEKEGEVLEGAGIARQSERCFEGVDVGWESREDFSGDDTDDGRGEELAQGVWVCEQSMLARAIRLHLLPCRCFALGPRTLGLHLMGGRFQAGKAWCRGRARLGTRMGVQVRLLLS